MPVGFKSEAEETNTNPDTVTRTSASARSSFLDTDDDDDMWAIFTRGLVVDVDDSSESASIESEKPFGFYLNIQGIMAIFSTCLEELSLLKRIQNTPIDKDWDVTVYYKSLEDRFGGSRQLVFEESEFDHLNDRQKVQKDICFLYNILQDGYNDLIERDNFESTVNAIVDMLKLMDDEEDLLEEEAENSARVKKWKQMLVNEKKMYLKAIADRKYELYMIKDEYEDKLVYGRYNVRYINDWESSRIFQNQLKRKQNEDGFQKIIDDSTTKMNFENRVHNEITTWLETNTDDMMDEISYWQQHYEEERDRRDLEIYNLKSQRDQTIEKLEDMKVLYQKHAEEIVEWLEIRDEKRRQEKIEQERLEAVVKIQAWWRGVMVRKHLGPFRRKKKGKGKKGKKDKKGKNKGLPGKAGGSKGFGKKKKK